MIYTLEKSELRFIFTTNDFILDQKIQDESLECYLANKYEYLYQLAFIKEENINFPCLYFVTFAYYFQ